MIVVSLQVVALLVVPLPALLLAIFADIDALAVFAFLVFVAATVAFALNVQSAIDLRPGTAAKRTTMIPVLVGVVALVVAELIRLLALVRATLPAWPFLVFGLFHTVLLLPFLVLVHALAEPLAVVVGPLEQEAVLRPHSGN